MGLPILTICTLLLAVWKIRAQESCFDEGSVQLDGFSTTHVGRVEVCVGGVWGSVCAASSVEPWSLKNAQVVCRQLKYVTALNTIPTYVLSFEDRASAFDPIHYSNVQCDGTQTSLEGCSKSNFTGDCAHTSDAVVVCLPDAVASGDVRLIGDTADYEGAVEYFDPIRGWTAICADPSHAAEWRNNGAAARVVCRQLGFEGGTPYVDSLSSSAIERVVVGSIDCNDGSDFSLADCQTDSNVFAIGDCTTNSVGWVECHLSDESDFSTRLVGGSREGVLEVSYNGRWGTICNDVDWSSTDAEVACEELGHTTDFYSIFTSISYDDYISRMKPVWLSGIDCSSSDESIAECSRDFVFGYSSTCSSQFSTTSSAEVDCGDPIASSLSGGAITGIVIACIAVVFVSIMAFIYVPQYWKKRDQYSWWRKLTTPSEWCGDCTLPTIRMPRRSNPTGVATFSAAPRQYPPPTIPTPTPTPATTTTTTNIDSVASSNQSPPPPTVTTPPAAPPPSSPDETYNTELSMAAPPSYDAATSYPTATHQPTVQPPQYTEKQGAYPPPVDSSLAYPPPQPSAPPASGQPYPPSTAPGLPYPLAGDVGAAYPPPQASGGYPYPN